MTQKVETIKAKFGRIMKAHGVAKGRFISETRWRNASEGYKCLWHLEKSEKDSYGWLNGFPEIRLSGTPKDQVEKRAAVIHSALQAEGVNISAFGLDSYIFG